MLRLRPDGAEGVVVVGILWRELSGVEGRGGDEDGCDLDFGGLDVWGAHDRILGDVFAKKGAQGVGRVDAGDFWVCVAHERGPHFDGATAFEDVYPDRAPN